MSVSNDIQDGVPAEPMSEAAEYALGLLSDDERAAFEQRMQSSSDLRDKVAFWQEPLAKLSWNEVEEVAPPPQVIRRIEAMIFKKRRRPLWPLILPYALGGAAAALTLWIAVSLGVLEPDTPTSRQSDGVVDADGE